MDSCTHHIPLSDDEDEETTKAMCVVRGLKTKEFMTILYDAYRSRNPMKALTLTFRDLGDGCRFNWGRIQQLMETVRWNEPERSDKTHPMGFVVDDIAELRNRALAEDDDRQTRHQMVFAYCYHATCMPQIWCRAVETDKLGTSVPYMYENATLCAYMAPNKPVPWVWFNANGHASITMMAHTMGEQYGDRTLRVAVYRRMKLGVVNTLCPDFTFDDGTRTPSPASVSSLLHIVVDTAREDGENYGWKIATGVWKPIKGWTFMIFLSEGSRRRFVSATLNDGTENILLRYPVVVHELKQ
jgi:hypothetical protein